MYDLVSMGEVMLRISPPKYQRLRQAHSWDVYVAGSQFNVAANLARLGRRTAFVTKLPANELGRLTINDCQAHGVDMSHVHVVDGARMGVNYVEFGVFPRPAVAVYDRQNSAASTIAPGEFAWADILSGTSLAYTDGIFPGLSPSCREAALEYVRAAAQVGCSVCFDMNYREHLWQPRQAQEAYSQLLPYVDVLVTNPWVSLNVFGYSGSEERMCRQYADDFGCEVVCSTSRGGDDVRSGSWDSLALRGGKLYQGTQVHFEAVDRFGSGDAWFAGFLHGLLGKDTQYALDFGNALCALAHTTEGDVVQVDVAEVEAFLEGDLAVRVKR